MSQNILRDDITKIEIAKDHPSAVAEAMELLNKMHPSVSKHGIKIDKFSYLQEQIVNSRNKNQVIQIMFNLFLSGEKLSVIGSNYQRKF
jgi:hypothetical protein